MVSKSDALLDDIMGTLEYFDVGTLAVGDNPCAVFAKNGTFHGPIMIR